MLLCFGRDWTSAVGAPDDPKKWNHVVAAIKISEEETFSAKDWIHITFNLQAELISENWDILRLSQKTDKLMVYLATWRPSVHHTFLKSMVTLKYLPLPPSTQKVVSLRKKIQNWDRWHCCRWINVTFSRVCQNDSCRMQVSIIRSDTNGPFAPK